MMSTCCHHTSRAELNAPIDVCLAYNQQACTASTQHNTDKNSPFDSKNTPFKILALAFCRLGATK